MRNDEEKRFEVVYEQKVGINERSRILRDRETGVCYLHLWVGAGSSVTPLLNRDGSPVVQD